MNRSLLVLPLLLVACAPAAMDGAKWRHKGPVDCLQPPAEKISFRDKKPLKSSVVLEKGEWSFEVGGAPLPENLSVCARQHGRD